jgi:hypothetical protein
MYNTKGTTEAPHQTRRRGDIPYNTRGSNVPDHRGAGTFAQERRKTMSVLAWKILALFVNDIAAVYLGEYGRGYITAWTLGEKLGGDATTINGVDVKIRPLNEYQRALRELIDLGLVEEMSELPERFRLVVKEK